MKTRQIAWITGVLLLQGMTANSAPVTWYLSGVTFEDGGTADGQFTYDADTDTYSNVLINTSSIGTLGATYDEVITGAGTDADTLMVSDVVSPSAGDWGFIMEFAANLTNAGGTVTVVADPYVQFVGSVEGRCLGGGVCVPLDFGESRWVTAGSVTTTLPLTTPELIGVDWLYVGAIPGDITGGETWLYDSPTQVLSMTGVLTVEFSSYTLVFTDLQFDLNAQTVSASAFECQPADVEGAGASICGGYTTGSNGLDDSTLDYSTIPATRTIGGDDVVYADMKQLADFSVDASVWDGLVLEVTTPSTTSGLSAAQNYRFRFAEPAPPVVEITSPVDESFFSTEENPMLFAASATDLADGDLTGSISWTSDVDGPISSPATLSQGLHLLTASVTDSGGLTDSDSIHVFLVEPFELEQFSTMTWFEDDGNWAGGLLLYPDYIAGSGPGYACEGLFIPGTTCGYLSPDAVRDPLVIAPPPAQESKLVVGSGGYSGQVWLAGSLGVEAKDDSNNELYIRVARPFASWDFATGIFTTLEFYCFNAPSGVSLYGAANPYFCGNQTGGSAVTGAPGSSAANQSVFNLTDGVTGVTILGNNGISITMQHSDLSNGIGGGLTFGGAYSDRSVSLTFSSPQAAAWNIPPFPGPSLMIIQPQDGQSNLVDSASVMIEGEAIDLRDGDISDDISWAYKLSSAPSYTTIGDGAMVSQTFPAGEITLQAHVYDSEVNSSGFKYVYLTVHEDADADGMGDQWEIDNGVTDPGVDDDGDGLTNLQEFQGGTPANDAPPTVMILAPANNSLIGTNELVNFAVSAVDDIDGDISSAVQWSSDLDGDLGTGSGISAALSAGVHQITASVTDSGGVTVQASIFVESGVIEDGDLNKDGVTDIRDLLELEQVLTE